MRQDECADLRNAFTWPYEKMSGAWLLSMNSSMRMGLRSWNGI